LLFFLLFGLLTNSIHAQSFTFNVIVDDNTPTGYCDVTSFTINITNTGGASAFTGLIKFKTLDFRIIDNSELPNLVVTTGNPQGKTHFDFTTPSIPMGNSVSYEYQLMVTPYDNLSARTVEHIVIRTANSYQLIADVNISSSEIEAIPQPGYSSIRISDLLDDNLPEGSGPAALFHLDENTTTDNYDTNPNKSQRLYIENELICDIPAYSIYAGEPTVPGIMVMEEGSKIIIEDGATLTINGQTLASCRKMWKGIYVESGGRLNLVNCIIANAQYGIQAERGATVVAYGNVFQDCYVGFYVSPFSYAQDPENPHDTYVNTENFSGNLFIGSGVMKPGYSGQSPSPTGDLPYAGIVVSNLSSFVLPGDAGLQTANMFENMHNGILVTNASFSLGDAFFKDIEFNAEYAQKIQGFGVYIKDGKYSQIIGNTIGSMAPYSYHFTNVHHAIYNSKGAIDVHGMTMSNVNTGIQLDAVANRRISIIDNFIQGFYKGITLNHCMPIGNGELKSNYIVISNEDDDLANHSACIEMNDYPVPTRWLIENNELTIFDARYAVYNAAGYETTIMNNTIDVEYYEEDEGLGIYLLGTNNVVVTCNKITGDIADANFHNSTGIYFEAAHEYNISCNEVDKFRYGIRPTSSNKGDLSGNILTDHYHGLYLGSGARSGIQILAGNTWQGNFEEEAAIHKGNIRDIVASIFYVDMSSTLGDVPPSIFPTSNWFKDKDGTTFICAVPEVCPEGVGYYSRAASWDSLDLDVIEGDLGFDDFDASKSWNERLHLYRRLHNVSVPALPTSISTFLSIQEDSIIGKFSNGYDSLFYAVKYTGAHEAVLGEFPSNLNRIFDDIMLLDSLKGTKLYNNDSLSTLMVARYDSIFFYEYNYLQKDSSINVILTEKVNNAISYIEDIAPDSIWHEELQFTLLEFLNLAATDTLRSSTKVYSLANTCPDKYGDPVYHARSLIREDSIKMHYDDDGLCGYLNPRTIVGYTTYSGLLFPNPAVSEISIESVSNIMEVQVFTLSGGEIYINSQISGSKAVIDVALLPAGLYHLRTFDDSGKIQFYKFVIARR